MTPHRAFAVVSLAIAPAGLCWVACGGTVNSPVADAGSHDSKDAGTDQRSAPDAASSDGQLDVMDAGVESGDDATYAGLVLATATQAATTTTFGVFADFAAGAPFGVGDCRSSDPSAGNCCCFHGATVLPGFSIPGAGTVTVTSDDGGAAPLATLTPSTWTATDSGSVTTTLQGTWDLGLPWFFFPGHYPFVDSGAWSPGDALRVSAPGDQVHAFSGTLLTGAMLSGVTPSIGAAPLVIDRARDFQLSWTPEGPGNETVLLMVQQFTTSSGLTCYCKVPDSAASVTVQSSLLGLFGTVQLMGGIRLERLITSTAASDNATIDLVGEVAQTGGVTFQ